MQIQTEENMIEFCNLVRGIFEVRNTDSLSEKDVAEFEAINREMIGQGKLSRDSHLQQGIVHLEYDDKTGVLVVEKPFLYPSPRISEENPELTGPMTGNLSNCYDPEHKRFLFHMRGGDIYAPYGLQAAAAGMGYFREHPGKTARRELAEEAGIHDPIVLFEGRAVDVLPFMKGGKIPQPLFSFGFVYDLSRFTVCESSEEIAEFETRIKKKLKEGTIKQREGYHFTIPGHGIERIAGELNDQKRFYGPIYESTINFLRALKDELAENYH